MKFRDIYNPRHVYDGWFETYFIRPYFHHYADFRGRESRRSYGMSVLAWVFVTLGLSGILMGLVGLLGPEVGFAALTIAGGLWMVLSVVPLAALTVRAVHGAPEREAEPKLLGVDTLFGVSAVLFFLFGLLMMITTLNSGALNPNAGMTDEADTSAVELEEVTEEPIFTYQTEEAVDTAPAVVEDSLSDMTEPDLVEPEESFDPSLVPPEGEIEAVSDTTSE